MNGRRSASPVGSPAWFKALAALILSATLVVQSLALGQPATDHLNDASVTDLGKEFVSDIASLRRTRLHYVRGGTGPAVVLVHGFPQDWYAFHRIMPRLAKKFTVIAVDLPGVGRSSGTPERYDAASLAEDILELVSGRELGRVYVAGHDNGGMVAYTFAQLYPDQTRGVMILDAPLPGIEPWEQVKADPVLWHFGFHQSPVLPEKLIAGRQFIYFREFFNRLALNRDAIGDGDVAHYAQAYSAPEQLRAGLEFYRQAYPASEKFNAGHRSPTNVPIVLAGGDHGVGMINPTIAEDLRKHGWANVSTELVKNSGHWVIDEQPDVVAELIEHYAAQLN